MHVGDEGIRQQWQSLLEEINGRLIRYGKENQIQLGTTISAVLLNSDGQYMLCHVGDTRIYTLSDTLQQLTEDHTFIAREIKRGNMTIEEAKKDNRRNVLLQCIGVNEFLNHNMRMEGWRMAQPFCYAQMDSVICYQKTKFLSH